MHDGVGAVALADHDAAVGALEPVVVAVESLDDAFAAVVLVRILVFLTAGSALVQSVVFIVAPWQSVLAVGTNARIAGPDGPLGAGRAAGGNRR
jgi:hypothetical protein